MSRLKVLLGVLVVLVLAVFGFGAYYLLRDSAEDPASLSAIPTGSTPAGTAARPTPDGSWKVQPGEGVFVGYRVHEILRGASKEVTGRTSDVTGTMVIAGRSITSGSFTADLRSLTSDETLRDNAIKRMGLSTDTFPEAKFVLRGPVTLPSAPRPGEKISVVAPGDLTLHGVTKPIEVPLEAQWDGPTIRAATTGGGVRIQFQDYGFEALTVPVAATDDFGFLEVSLAFVPA